MADLQTKINDGIKEAMKANDTLKKDTLKFLKGELERNRIKSYSDADISKMAKKLIEGYKEAGTDNGEVAILEDLVMEQFSEDELKVMVAEVIFHSESKPNMGQLMSYFKINHEGHYDGAALSKIVKEILA